MYVGKKDLEKRIKKFSPNQIVFQRSEESKNDYGEKISSIADYSYVKNISDKFFRDCQAEIHNFSWNEQVWLASAAYELNIKGKYKKFVDFAKKYGARGLRSFFSSEVDLNNGEKIINIGEKLKEADAKKVFAKILELGNLAQKKDKELSEVVYKEDKKDIPVNARLELMRHTHNIISKFSDELDDKKIDNEKILKLIEGLEQSRIEIDLIASLLVAAKKEGASENLEDIKGLEVKKVNAEELKKNNELWEKLNEMYFNRNAGKSKEDLARLASAFEEHQKHDPKFYLMYFDQNSKMPEKNLNNLVGFIRSSSFDGENELSEGERYLGGMNIDPLLQKFYLGENFLREVVEKEFLNGVEKVIAHVPENSASHKACLAIGFENIGFEGSYKDDNGKDYAKRVKISVNKENFRKLQDEFSLKEAA